MDALDIINAHNAAKAGANARKGVVVDKDQGGKSSNVNNVSPTLSTNEKTRYEKIFQIMKDVLNPDPEARRTTNAAAQSKAANISAATKAAATADAKKANSGLLGLLAALAAAIGLLGENFMDTIQKYLYKGLAKLTGFILKHSKGLIKSLGKLITKGVSGAAKLLGKGLKAAGRTAMKAMRGAIKGATKVIKNIGQGILKSKPMQALKGAIKTAFTNMGTALQSAKSWFAKQATKLTASPVVQSLTKGAANTKSFFGKAMDWGSEKLTKAKEFGSRVVSKGTDIAKAAVGKVAGWATWGKQKAINFATSTLRKAAGSAPVQFLGKVAKRIPILGPAIEAVMGGYDVMKLREQYEAGNLPLEQFHEQVGNRVVEGVGASLGGGLGAVIGGSAGVIGGPVGVALGGLAGGILGDMAGRTLGPLIFDAIFSTGAQKKQLGEYASGVPSIQGYGSSGGAAPMMNDFFVQNGNMYPFSSRDSLLGMKSGGAIDRLLSSRDSLAVENTAVFSDIRNIGIAQLEVLKTIRDGIKVLVGVASAPPSVSQINFSQNQPTSDFYTA